MKSYILAIDPGNVYSGYCLCRSDTLKPVEFGKVENLQLLEEIKQIVITYGVVNIDYAIEMIASYGMAVGKTVFDTCVWVGRFYQHILANDSKARIDYIYRAEEKSYICHSPKATDSNVRRALIDRFAQSDFKHGKGTKKKPDWFYGFKNDIWAAYAVAVTWSEKQKEMER